MHAGGVQLFDPPSCRGGTWLGAGTRPFDDFGGVTGDLGGPGSTIGPDFGGVTGPSSPPDGPPELPGGVTGPLEMIGGMTGPGGVPGGCTGPAGLPEWCGGTIGAAGLLEGVDGSVSTGCGTAGPSEVLGGAVRSGLPDGPVGLGEAVLSGASNGVFGADGDGDEVEWPMTLIGSTSKTWGMLR